MGCNYDIVVDGECIHIGKMSNFTFYWDADPVTVMKYRNKGKVIMSEYESGNLMTVKQFFAEIENAKQDYSQMGTDFE